MCDPLWSQLFSPCTIEVHADVSGTPTINATLDDGSGHREITLPHRVDLGPTSACRVDVQVSGSGTVILTATAEDQRDPDQCILRVDKNHPIASASVFASTR